MLHYVLAVLLTMFGGTAAAGCPGLGFKDDELHMSARQLVTPKVAEVRAGGTVLLGHCDALPGKGNISFDPTLSIYYIADRKRMDLEFATVGNCDTVLLVRTPSGRWFFDDDNGPQRNAKLRLSHPPEGRYEIWVGSEGGFACQTSLKLQTFRATVRLAQNAP